MSSVIQQPTAQDLSNRNQPEGSSAPLRAGHSTDLRAAQPPATVKCRPAAQRKLNSLHSRKAIDAILHRESARCERNGNEFSLVVIAAATSRARRHLQRLARLACRRVRLADELGWFDSKQVCVVLPDTTADGAMGFVRGYIESAYFQGLSPICRVLTYPNQESDDAGEILPQEETAGASVEGEIKESTKTGNLAPLLIQPLPWWKRAIDMAVSGVAIVLASPILALAALAIKLSDPGPVLFKQRRAGLGGRPFTIYKFRTMIVGAEEKQATLIRFSEQDGPAFKLRHDPRITRVGRILRESSLDELPQLWNILKGDMSLVGPRPLPLHESDQCDVWHRRRLDVTPGLTCIWQVEGRSTVSFTQWIRMDRKYICSRSFWHDLKLILLTVPAVLRRRGAR